MNLILKKNGKMYFGEYLIKGKSKKRNFNFNLYMPSFNGK